MRRGAALLALLFAGPALVAEGPVRQRIVETGIAVELSVEPAGAAGGALLEGEDAVFRFRISDTTTGTPLSGLYPAAWMELVHEGVEGRGCAEKVKDFLGGSVFAKPELDLNSYYVLSLNDDASITVVDPFFGFGGSKLLAMVLLESPGEDWTLSADRKRLYVSQPALDKVAVVDTHSWKVAATLPTAPRPRRLALQPDEAHLWVAWEGKAGEPSGVDVFDPRTGTRAGRIVTGPGAHEIAFDPDNRFAFVTNRAGGTVSVIDVRRLAKVRDVKTGAEPVSLAFSAQAGAAYVAHADGWVAALDGAHPEPVARFRAEPGLGRLSFAPGGRFGFVVNPGRDQVFIFDASRNRVVKTANVGDGPDQVAFSADLAYVRHRGSEIVLMIPLGVLAEEGVPVQVIDFPGGQKPFGEGAESSAPGIVQAPGAKAVLVANPADRVVYYYKEGMAAPMGSFVNYGRQPRAVLVVDRSLKERAPGTYESAVTLRGPGKYDLALYLESPRVVHCFPVAVGVSPELEKRRMAAAPPRVEYVDPVGRAVAGRPLPLRLRIVDPVTQGAKAGLSDVTVLSYKAPGSRQVRQQAVPGEAGVYEVELTPDEPGVWYVVVQSRSAGLRFWQSPALLLDIAPEERP
jgi:YVTN family beta-propeller protein